jgi:hypothetical protein
MTFRYHLGWWQQKSDSKAPRLRPSLAAAYDYGYDYDRGQGS